MLRCARWGTVAIAPESKVTDNVPFPLVVAVYSANASILLKGNTVYVKALGYGSHPSFLAHSLPFTTRLCLDCVGFVMCGLCVLGYVP